MKRLKPLVVVLLMVNLLVFPTFSEPVNNGVLDVSAPPEDRLPQGGSDYDRRQTPVYERWYVINAEGTFNTDDGAPLPIVLHLVKTISIRPSDAMRLLKENKSLEEIRAEIDNEGEGLVYRGYLQLGELCYRLVDVALIEEENNLTVNANLVELQKDLHPGKDIVVGHVAINATQLVPETLDDQVNSTIGQPPYYGNYIFIPNV